MPSTSVQVLATQGMSQDPRAGARSAAGAEIRTPALPNRIEKLARDLNALTVQNRQLLQGVGRLLDLYEAEKAQRLTLQASLDRAVMEMAAAKESPPARDIATDTQRMISDDLKPMLQAILDLLEVTMLRSPAATDRTAGLNAPNAVPSVVPDTANDTEANLGPSDDLPRALPEILTKPVEELVESARTKGNRDPIRRPPDLNTNQASFPKATAKSNQRHSMLPERPHTGAWIPVISDKAKS